MRLLVFSDIHNNEAALTALRRREANVYDALVVAGDIGNRISGTFKAVADSFDCPVFFVYGNWDSGEEYVARPSKHCVLLHHQVEACAGYYFAGFSGLPMSWGNNPIYQELLAGVKTRHSSTLNALAVIQAEFAQQSAQIDQEFKARGTKLRERNRKVSATPAEHRKARDRLRQWRDRKVESLRAPEQRFRDTESYKNYRAEQWDCIEEAQALNRRRLLASITNAGIPTDRLILVTHERQHKLHEDGLTPLLHIYGHRHRHEFTKFKGAHYLNAAPLDWSCVYDPDGSKGVTGRYCRVDISDSSVQVEVLAHGPHEPSDSMLTPGGGQPSDA